MKKLIFTLVVTLGVFASAAAQDGGRMWIGGNVGFEHTKSSIGDFEEKSTSFSILPEFGYFFTDNFALAGRLGYEHSKVEGYDEDGDPAEAKTNAFVINPFVRYTFLKGSIGGLFVDGGVTAKFGKAYDENLFSIGVGITPGATINIGNGFALTAAFGFFGYTHEEIKFEPEKLKTDDMKFGFNFNKTTVGVLYSF